MTVAYHWLTHSVDGGVLYLSDMPARHARVVVDPLVCGSPVWQPRAIATL